MKKLLIFGTGDIAELAHYYFTNDSEFDVVAFVVDQSFRTSDELLGLPVIDYHEIEAKYPSEDHYLFIALSYSKLNSIRKSKFLDARKKGYRLVSYISSHATVLNDGKIGDNCFILENNTIQPFVSIGDNVTLWSGNHIGHHSMIGDHTFVASHVVVSGGVNIGEQCFIGVNATLRDHIQVGHKSVIGAGVLLLESADDESLYIGERTVKSTRGSSKLKKI